MEFRDPSTEKTERKIRYFCSYQERTQQQVRDKLYSFGLHRPEVELLISKLIEEDYLNEERYAIMFAGGKFRVNKWGRVKIRHALQQEKLSAYCINKALTDIDEEQYMKVLQRLATSKFESLASEKNPFTRKQKTTAYLLQKGFEFPLIQQCMPEKG